MLVDFVELAPVDFDPEVLEPDVLGPYVTDFKDLFKLDTNDFTEFELELELEF